MDHVPLAAQLDSQLGGHDPAPAVGRVAADADVHFAPLSPQKWATGSSTARVSSQWKASP